MRVFDNGHSLHHRYEKLFADMGILVKDEMKLEADNISGHTDAWIRVFSLEHPRGMDYLVELKSAFSKSFDWMIKNNRAKREHLDQIMFYLHLVRKMGIQIDRGIIYVENKDNQEVWEHEVQYDAAYGQRLEEKANWCIEMAKERVLPNIPPQHTPSYYKCSICDYNIYCYADNVKRDGTVRYPNPFKFGSKAYVDTLNIVNAIKEGKPIPNVILSDTNGGLATEVEYNRNTPDELIGNYIKSNQQ